MAHDAHSSAVPNVPASLIARHSAGWKSFTQATVLACASVAAVLVLMLLVFKVF